MESLRKRAGEDGAPEGWTPIPGWQVAPGLDEVTEFLVERRVGCCRLGGLGRDLDL